MPTTQLPLMKGLGKNYASADYLDLLPVNMLATPKQVLDSNGYMRSFPGLSNKVQVGGASRGVLYNTLNNFVYRVLGGFLYRGATSIATVPGSGRTSMAYSSNSHAVAAAGKMQLYRYDGVIKALDNWPDKIVTTPESDKIVRTWVSTSGDANANLFDVDQDNAVGSFVITLTPRLSNGLNGDDLVINENQWNRAVSQDASQTKPYLTNVTVTGRSSVVSTVTISYVMNSPAGSTATNQTRITVVQHMEEVSTQFSQYEIGSVKDICRLRGRYIWVKDGTDTFGVTDVEDESHPDRYRPFYRAESQPDGIQGCAVWRDFAVMFGTSTIEYFSLTGASDSSSAIYVAQPSLMVSKGIAGTHCKAEFSDNYAFISHPSTGAPSIYVINSGQLITIATSSIEKILRSYTEDELSTSVMESVRFDSHELLIVHLPNHVLCYDASASQNNNMQWSVLKSGLGNDVHRAIDYAYSNNSITVGDKAESITGSLNFDLSSQYEAPSEHILYTPLFKADNARVFDFELESSSGVSQRAERLFISATADGINYGREQMLSSNEPFSYDRRVLWRRIGRIRKNIGFKVRVVTKSPVTLSGCSVRVE